MDQDKIGSFIKKLRKDNNLSQQAFADKIGVTFQAVSKWENGKNLPDISTLKEIKKQFNVNIDEIIDGESIPNKKKIKFLIISIILALILISLIIFILFHFKNMNNYDNKFKFEEVTSANSDFQVSGNVVKTNDRTSLIINNVFYTKDDDNIEYEELNCDLYEEKNAKENKITSCDNAKNLTLREYLGNLKIKMDHYTNNCPMFIKSNMFIQIEAIKDNKTVIYKIPIKIDDNSCN